MNICAMWWAYTAEYIIDMTHSLSNDRDKKKTQDHEKREKKQNFYCEKWFESKLRKLIQCFVDVICTLDFIDVKCKENILLDKNVFRLFFHRFVT